MEEVERALGFALRMGNLNRALILPAGRDPGTGRPGRRYSLHPRT
jgi:hypothetical protein